MLMPWLDELVHLSVEGEYMRRFNRIQALWFAIADVIAPFMKVSSVRLSASQRSRVRPTSPRRNCQDLWIAAPTTACQFEMVGVRAQPAAALQRSWRRRIHA